MDIIQYPEKEQWGQLLKRPELNVDSLRATVASVLADIRKEGDEAAKRYEKLFDKVSLASLCVSAEEIAEGVKNTPQDLRESLELAASNIRKFHEAQRFSTIKVETQPGVTCWQKAVPIEKVGLYIPGGTAPLFSTVLMLAIPAKIAGCGQILLCTPPSKDGKVNPAILCAASIAGVDKIFKIGGVQAIGAMAYGTQSVPKVDKIFGPGNQYVVAAKQQVSLSDVAIDMPAGPSEVEVLADGSANPEFVAADLLSQAEHGVDSQVLLVTTDPELVQKVEQATERQLALLPRKEIAAKALANSRAVLLHNMDEAVEFTNAYAPEHLILSVEGYSDIAERITHAGSVFLGQWSCESAGDYASGTNHTLPTKGYARAYSGLCLDSFVRKMTFQELTPDGIRHIAKAVETMAGNEQLDAHREAMRLRREYINSKKQ
jgi:histidinol dehydrogenase